MLRHAAVPCVCLLLLAFPATSARAQWQTLPVVDELTSKQAVVALAEGAHGHMRMRAKCRDGFYILELSFSDDSVLADGAVLLACGRTNRIERQYWRLENHRQHAWVTTRAEDDSSVRYDADAVAFFDNLRRHPYVEVRSLRYPALARDRFDLTGAPEALDALNCPHP